VATVSRHILSRGRVLALAVNYIMAVRKLIGLKRYEIQIDFGSLSSSDHSTS
jgi:hypothetical protein